MTKDHQVASREEWLVARRELLEREKGLQHQRDELAAQRRALPWVHVDKAYEFDTSSGPQSLSDLFAGRSQLLVFHFMLGPQWTARGLDPINSTYQLLDLAPKGRDEGDLPWPMAWVRRHDAYEAMVSAG